MVLKAPDQLRPVREAGATERLQRTPARIAIDDAVTVERSDLHRVSGWEIDTDFTDELQAHGHLDARCPILRPSRTSVKGLDRSKIHEPRFGSHPRSRIRDSL